MAGSNFDLSVRLRMAVEGLTEVQSLISEIEELGGETERSASRSQKLADELRELEDSQKLVDNFRNLRTEVGRTGDELDVAQAEAQRLGKELGSTSRPTKKLESDFEKARKTVNRLKNTQIEQTRALQTNRKALSDTGISSQKLSSAQTEIRQSMARTSGEVEDLTRELKEARDASAKEFRDPTDRLERGARTSGRAMDGLGTRIRSVARTAVTSVAAFLGIREAIRGITGIVSVGGDFEILEKRLEALTGSAEAGEEAFAWIRDFTKNTPFQLEQVTDAFVRAKAFGLDPMNGTLQAVADQAAKTGGGMEALNGIVTALGQSYSKGKIQAEEMLQLVERGVPAWDLLAKATGNSVAELQKMTTAGQLGRREIKLLIDELGRAGTGAAEEQMSSLQGIVSNLSDTWTEFLNEINQQGLLEYFKGQISDIAAAFQEMKESGELEEMARSISDGIIAMTEALKTVVTTIYENIGALKLLAQAYVGLKLSQVTRGVISLAAAMKVKLVGGTVAATRATRLLANALRAVPWILVIQGAISAADAYRQYKDAKDRLDESLARGNKVQAEATRRIQEFNEQTGYAVTSLKEIIQLQDEGAVSIDEYTGKWRLASDQLTEAEKAQRAQAEATREAREELKAMDAQVRGLVDTFKASQGAGDDLVKSIEAMGAAAIDQGEDGIAALSISLERLALEGKATRRELSDGLGEYLAGLSSEQYTRFGDAIVAELEKIEQGADDANNRLSFMQTLLEADLAAAAKRAGVDINEVLTGIDESSQAAIDSFTDLAERIKAAGTESEKADEILKAGLEQTLESLGNTEEVDAAIASIQALGEAGILSSQQVAVLTAEVREKGAEIKAASEDAADAQKELGDEAERTGARVAASMQEAAAGTQDLADASRGAADDARSAVSRVRGMAEGIGGFYDAITERLVQLSTRALAAFRSMHGAAGETTELEALSNKIQTLDDQITSLRNGIDYGFTGITSWFRDTALASKQVERDFLAQKLALEQLVEQFDRGEYSAADLNRTTQDLRNQFNLLGDQDLAPLTGAIERLKAEADSLGDSLNDTISSLRQELASLRGDTEQVEQLRYQEEKLELEQQLQRARELGDQQAIAAAQEALALQREAYQLRAEQARLQKEEEQERAAQQAAEQERQQQQQEREQRERSAEDYGREEREDRQQRTREPKGQRVDLVLPSGSASVSGDPDDVNRLLEFLNEAGLRATE